jgi:hypothetical protein
MNSKGGESPLARAPGTNPLIKHLEAMYEEIKQRKSSTNEGVDITDPNGMQKQQALDQAAGQYYQQQAAGNTNARVTPGKDLGNGFTLSKTTIGGVEVPAVYDTQSKTFVTLNKNPSTGTAIYRTMAMYIVISNGKPEAAMEVGPATTAALKKAGM